MCFLYGLSFVKNVPIFNIQIIIKGAHLNFAMGATLHRYATGAHGLVFMQVCRVKVWVRKRKITEV